MGLPFNRSLFSGERERSITTYDFWDLAQNRAVNVFYPIQYNDGDTKKYGLTTSTSVPSSVTNIRNTQTGPNYIKDLDVNFETIVDQQFTIQGDAYMVIPHRIDGDANDTGSTYVSGGLFISGATLKTLGGGAGQVTTITATQDLSLYTTLRITIPETKVKKGEYLRFNMQSWSKAVAGGTIWTNVGWDPSAGLSYGGTGEHSFNGTVKSRSAVSIPVKIEL